MPPASRKKQHEGILAIDPSWRGMGIASRVAVHDFSFTESADITGGVKRFDMPQTTVRLVSEYFRELFHREPRLRCCSRVVLENQFKTKMKNLLWIVAACVSAHMPHATLEFVSALGVKRHFGLELQESHYWNKQLAVEFVGQNADRLIGAENFRNGRKLEDLSDGEADSLLLLNYSVEHNKLELMSYGKCKKCDADLEAKVSQSEKNPGRVFLRCPNGQGPRDGEPGNECNNSFSWLGADGKPEPKKWTGQKRAAPEATGEPAAKRSVDESAMLDALKKIAEGIDWIKENLHKPVKKEPIQVEQAVFDALENQDY